MELGCGAVKKKKKISGMRARCLFLWWVNASVGVGEASGLAGAVCYRGSPGPPGVPSCWPESEGLSLGQGEESEPMPEDG